MNPDVPPEVIKRHQERIAAFTLRARRVGAHSLLADLPRFQKWAEGTIDIGPVDGVVYMTQDVPPEEAFESLASRCRPFLLSRDPVHWQAVFGSLRAFLKDSPRLGPAMESLRSSWAEAVAPAPETGFAAVRPDEVESQAVWFSTLAESWLYGDLVHADPVARNKAAGHTLNTRYCAAVLLYGQVAVHVIATLNLIRQARLAGLLEFEDETFTEPVTVDVPMRFPVVAYAQAEVGTPAQQLLNALDSAQNPATDSANGEKDGPVADGNSPI